MNSGYITARSFNPKYAILSQTKAKNLTDAEVNQLGPLGWTIATEAQCLNDVLLNLREELEKVGRYRHRTKRLFGFMSANVCDISSECYRVLYKVDTEVARDYLEFYELMLSRIDDAVYVQGVERAINIAFALIRETIRNNDTLWEFGLGIPIVEDKIYPWRKQYGIEARDILQDIAKEEGIRDYGLDSIVRDVFSRGNTLCFVTKQEERILDADKREQALKRLKKLNK